MGNVIAVTARGCNGTENCTGRFERCVAEYVNMSQKLRAKKRNFDSMKSSLGHVLVAACRTMDENRVGGKKKRNEFVPGGMERVVFGEPARSEREAQSNVISTSLEMLGANNRHSLTHSAMRDFFLERNLKT